MSQAAASTGSFRGMRLHALAASAARFGKWWASALAGWVPARLRPLLGLSQDRVVLRLQDREVALALRHGSGERVLGMLPMPESDAVPDPLHGLLDPAVRDLPRSLLLPAATGLRRMLVLPAAAAERLHDVVGFEIDRQTPFAAPDVEYDAVVRRHRPDGQVDVELGIVPKPQIDQALRALGPIAPTLATVDLADERGAPVGLNVLPAAMRRQRANPWALWNLALLAISACALFAALWLVLANRTSAIDAYQQQVDGRHATARRAAVQRQLLGDTVSGLVFLQRARAQRPTMVETLEELTRRLPDGTYLEKIAVEDDKLVLMGLSNQASSLVGFLEGSRLWSKPALSGAVQPDPRSGLNRFTIMADMATGSAGEGGDARNR